MRELADHLLDILQNSFMANVTQVQVEIIEDLPQDLLTIRVCDDGCGMEPEFLARVTDPFVTSRRKLTGLGLPLLAQAAQMAGGQLTIQSQPDQGTTVIATFQHSHWDRAPLGNIPDCLVAALTWGDAEIVFEHRQIGQRGEVVVAQLETAPLRALLEGVPLSDPQVLQWIRTRLRESYQSQQRE